MRYALAGVAALVDDDAIAGVVDAFLAGHSGGDGQQVAEQRFILRFRLRDAPDVFLWNDKDMNRRLWADVAKRQRPVVFVNNRGRDFLANDLGENVVGHGRASYSSNSKLNAPARAGR